MWVDRAVQAERGAAVQASPRQGGSQILQESEQGCFWFLTELNIWVVSS